MTEKYYTPDITEFHVGFEFEHGGINNGLNDWFTIKLELDDSLDEINLKLQLPDVIRVKYLDKEDVESLGWKHTFHSIDEWFEIEGSFNMGSWTSYKAVMHYGLKDHRLYITMYDTGVEGPSVFQGTIKNKSELKKLMQQLNII